jgi:hypothetical protein
MRLRSRRIVAVVVLASALGVLGVSAAAAFAAAPIWSIRSVALPTDFSEEDTKYCDPEEVRGCDAYAVTVTNVGSVPSTGPIVFKDTLPAGTALEGIGYTEEVSPPELGPAGERIPAEHNSVGDCTEEAASVRCEYEGVVPPGGIMSFPILVATTAQAGSSVTNVAEVQGGGAPLTVSAEPNAVGTTSPAFGTQEFSVDVFGDPTQRVQAGDHPASISTSINYTTILKPPPEGVGWWTPAVEEAKTSIVDLPAGFVGDPLAAGTCPESALYDIENHPARCGDSRVGVAALEFGTETPHLVTIFNVVPESGYPAEFGFEFDGAVVLLKARLLPTSGGYVLSVSVPDILRPANYKLTGLTLTLFGDPTEVYGAGNGEAFLTNPDACGAPTSKARLEMDSWVEPEQWVSQEAPVFEAASGQAVTGCGALRFEPSIEVKPEQTTADTPSGYEVDLKVPQARNAPGLLATPDLKSATVTLPQGVAISPDAADGLAGCEASGPEGIELGSQDRLADENRVQEGEELGVDGLVHPAPGNCPAASQIGEVEVVTPLLATPLKGHVYVAEPSCGGQGQPACTQASATNGELYGLYLEVEGSGVIVKLKGTVSANPSTGQLTTTFEENPQLPFSELKLWLNGGGRAPLANPQTCGTVTATSDLTPWSEPVTPDATPFSSFSVDGCAGPTPFAPSFSAGTATANAGAFSPFTLTFARHDGEQDLSGLTVTTPPGLLGVLKSVVQCPESQVARNECGEASLIGHTEVAVGSGSEPFWIAGSVYLTGPYDGAPFGLSVVTPAKAGPFNLGDVRVRAAIHVNPSTSALTVTSDPFPQIVDGVPLRIQTVSVSIERPGFMFNPTNCVQQQIAGTISSAQGASASVSKPFAAAGCASLPFKPAFAASTAGKASKAGGASLDVRVSSKGGPQAGGGEANIRSVKVDLPKQLPSRLTTLQRACLASVFEANPAACPKESDVGSATAVTPLLANPLSGPAYLVSHGGAAFPDLEIVLQGEGITLILDGQTQIKHGITSSTFGTVPDAPISSFELKLPTGKYSVLGTDLPTKAGYDLCGQTLSMPTEITAQNGAVIKQTTKIRITGCPPTRPKADKAAKKKAKAKKATKTNRRGK